VKEEISPWKRGCPPYPRSTSSTGYRSFQHTFLHIERKITLNTVKDGMSPRKQGYPPLYSVYFRHRLQIIPANIPAYGEENYIIYNVAPPKNRTYGNFCVQYDMTWLCRPFSWKLNQCILCFRILSLPELAGMVRPESGKPFPDPDSTSSKNRLYCSGAFPSNMLVLLEYTVFLRKFNNKTTKLPNHWTCTLLKT
jgi:hypothetical protein